MKYTFAYRLFIRFLKNKNLYHYLDRNFYKKFSITLNYIQPNYYIGYLINNDFGSIPSRTKLGNEWREEYFYPFFKSVIDDFNIEYDDLVLKNSICGNDSLINFIGLNIFNTNTKAFDYINNNIVNIERHMEKFKR